MKSQKGFTLIEVIVVAVIMGILAAVAIPFYTGILNDQKMEAVKNLAETGAAAANAIYRRTGTALTPDSEVRKNEAPLNLYFDDSKYKVEILASEIRVTDLKKSSISKTVTYK